MEALIQDVNWLAVVVGAVLAFGLGWLWYSKSMFGEKWARGSRINMDAGGGMGMAMLAQGVATFLLAWVIGITETTGSLALAGLIALTCAGLIKSNGLWAQKSTYAIAVDSGYILAMAVVMVLTHAVI